MTSVASLAVGKELLIGKTLNTNCHWIGARLALMGGMLDSILTVTDSLGDISWGLNELLSKKPDFLVVVGGLGPTPDDMTLEGIARALGRRMQLNSEALGLIKEHYRLTGREVEITPVRRKMAILPAGATPLRNDVGTAPGVRMEHSRTVIFSLPGVPSEMKSIYRQTVEPEIRSKMGKVYTKKVVMHLERIYESTLAPSIEVALTRHPSSYIKSHPKGMRGGTSRIELDIVVTSKVAGTAEPECKEIASFLAGEVAKAGGVIARQTGL